MMGWEISYDTNWNREIGYGVPATCDHPGCDTKIDRGLSHVCGGVLYGGKDGCGLFFCDRHIGGTPQLCDRCASGNEPFDAEPDLAEWIRHKLTHKSWQAWRDENPREVAALKADLIE